MHRLETIRHYINRQNLVYLLIFLFPIAGMSVKHWITGIYNLLFLIALFSLWHRPRQPLEQAERVLLYSFAAFFAVFILSAVVNGWGEMQTRYLGTELRFLMIIPIYLLLRQYPDAGYWLLRGAILGAFLIFGQAYYEVMIEGQPTATGQYSKNLIGPLSALFVVWLLIDWRFERKTRIRHVIYALAICAAIVTVLWSGSRGAYVGLLLVLALWSLLYVKARWVIGSLTAVVAVVAISYLTSDIMREGVDKANQEFSQYFKIEDPASYKKPLSSVGTRLEMLRATQFFFRDSPVLGIGPGNYQQAAGELASQGLVHRDASVHGHPHNAFLEALISKGLVGLLTLMLILYFPLYYFIRTYKQSPNTAMLGTTHIMAMSAFMLTDASPILMNNFSSLLLLGLVVFFSWHVANLQLLSKNRQTIRGVDSMERVRDA